MRNDLLKNLTAEQLEKARACKDNNELLSLAKQEGVELTDEQLKAVTGGCGHNLQVICPNCQSTDIETRFDSHDFQSRGVYQCKCRNCGEVFKHVE